MKARPTLILLLALLAASIAVGCGGGDEDGEGVGSTPNAAAESESAANQDSESNLDGSAEPSPDDSPEPTITASSLSKAAFVKKVDPVCARAEARIFEPTEQGETSEKEAEEVVIQRLGPALESIADGIRSVGAPAGDEDQVEAIAGAFQQAAEEIEDSDPSAFPEAEAFLVAPSDLADEYGLRRCVFK